MKKIFCLLVLFWSFKSFSQTASGSLQFSSDKEGFTSATWSLTYAITLEFGEGKGSVWLRPQSATVSYGRATFRNNGKIYSPSDLGFAAWPSPTISEDLFVDVTVFYKGKLARKFESFQTTAKSGVRLGSFNSTNSERKEFFMGVGGLSIPFEGFDIRDFTATVSGDTYNMTVPIGNSTIVRKIEALAQGKSTSPSKTGAVSIGNGSTNSGSSSSSSSSGTSTSSRGTSGTTAETESQRQYREQRERIAESQRQSDELSNQIVKGTTELVSMVGNILASNRADREKKEAKKEAEKKEKEEQKKRDEEQRKRFIAIRQEKIKELNNNLAYYLPEARKGNNNAINTVIEIYDKKTELYENNALDAKVAFLEEIYNINKSGVATTFLKNYYSKIVNEYKQENKHHISRSIQNTLVGGALYSIRIFVPKKYDVNGKSNLENNIMYRGVFGLGGAAYFGITGFVHLFRIGYKNKPKYIEANNKLKKLNSNSPKITFSPNYDLQQGSLGLAIRIKL